MVSCEFCGFSKNTFFTEHLGTTASIFEALFLVKIFLIKKRLLCKILGLLSVPFQLFRLLSIVATEYFMVHMRQPPDRNSLHRKFFCKGASKVCSSFQHLVGLFEV